MKLSISRVTGFFWRKISRYLAYQWLQNRGVSIESDHKIVMYGLPIIERATDASITLGTRVVLCSKSHYTALGISRPVIIRAMAAGADICIGSDVGLSGTTICANKKISIGNSCLIGADVMICDTDFHAIDSVDRRYGSTRIKSEPVSIGNNVFLGARSIVLKGVTIGENSIIGAGSVVTSDIPANSIAAGNPCRVIKKIELFN